MPPGIMLVGRLDCLDEELYTHTAFTDFLCNLVVADRFPDHGSPQKLPLCVIQLL